MTRLTHALITASVVSLALVRPLSAAYTPTWVPGSLSPGETYHLVFVTSTTTTPTNTSILHYDGIADGDGDTMSGSPYGDVDWYCLGSTADDTPLSRGLVSGPVFRLDGSPVASGYADLYTGGIDNLININNLGTVLVPAPGNQYVYTGTRQVGETEYPFGAGTTTFGYWSLVTSWWTDAGKTIATIPWPIYAISEPLTVAGGGGGVPEPGTLILAVLSVAAGGATLRRRRRRTGDRK